MPTQKEHFENRIAAIKALNKYKANHTMQEIADKTSIPVQRLRSVSCVYSHLINPEVKAKRHSFASWKLRKPTEVKQKIRELVAQGHSIKYAAMETGTDYSTTFRIVHGITKNGRKPNKDVSVKKNIETVLLHQYRDANFDVTPLFLIKTHNITPSTAARICEKLRSVI